MNKFNKLYEIKMFEATNKNTFKNLFKSGDKLELTMLWDKGSKPEVRTVEKFDGLEWKFKGMNDDKNLGFMPYDHKDGHIIFSMNGKPYMKVIKK